MRKLLAFCFATLLNSGFSQDACLDTNFGNGGKVTTIIGPKNDVGLAIVTQPDDRLVVAGYTEDASGKDIALVRYMPNGNRDNSFGSGGIVTTKIGSGDDVANALAIQSDGKIVIAGNSNNGVKTDFALVRYNADGSLDTSFGTGGKVITAIGTYRESANSVAIQPDGKIVVGGSTFLFVGLSYFAVVRYNPDGSLDSTFNSDGKATAGFGPDYYDEGYSLLLQPDGKILMIGVAATGSTTFDDFGLIRFNTNGRYSVDGFYWRIRFFCEQ